jgi:hypothetical protein
MAAVVLENFSQNAQVMFPAGNIAAASITKLTPTAKQPDPTAGGIMELTGPYVGQSAAQVEMQFFGTTTDATAFVASLYGWDLIPTPDNGVTLPLWVPKLLCSFSAITLDSGMPGVAGTPVPAVQLFATAITLGTGTQSTNVDVLSPGHGKDIAHVTASVKGSRYLQILLATTTNVDCNGLWRVL